MFVLPASVHHVPDPGPPPPVDDGPPRLVVTSAATAGSAILLLAGRLDADSVVALTSLVDQLWAEQPAEAVLDLSGLSAIDSSGSAALGDIRRAGQARGIEVRLTGAVPETGAARAPGTSRP